MLYLVHHAEAVGDRFVSPLTHVGLEQSLEMINALKNKNVVMIYTAPSKRAIETITPYKLASVNTSSVVRVQAHYDLYTHVDSPEKQAYAVDLEYLQDCGMNRQSVYGVIPETVETFETFRSRVLQWFTNVCFEEYRESPVPTVVVADALTLSIIMYYLMSRMPYDDAEEMVMTLCPGSIHAFRGNGLSFDFPTQVQ